MFELFARRLPEGRRYGVVAGVGRLLDALDDFRFDQAELDWLREADVVDADTIQWLADYRFTGDVWGYPDGELYFPQSPVLIVEGTFAECVILETVFLSILNHDSAIASAAARMISAAGDRPCIEMGSRRTHEASAVAAARSAYIAGFAATSNLEAGRTYGIPTTGTSAHSFTLLHDTERDAFEAQVRALGPGTTLLVDTYDVPEAIRTAVDVAGPELGGVRLDSGDLVALAAEVRKQLDDLGATSTRITVTSDLDEYAIAALAAAPVDGYGVGTALVTGSGRRRAASSTSSWHAPATTARWCRSPRRASDKISVGGRKSALRRRDADGTAQAEVIGIDLDPVDDGDDRPLLVELVRDGARVHKETLDDARERLRARRSPSCRRRRCSSCAANPPSTPSTRRHQHDARRTDRRRRAERLLRGRIAGRRRRRQVAADVAELLATKAYATVVATRDHHIDPGAHFSDTPDFVDSWPRHCVVGTPGEEFHPPLEPALFDEIFYKGEYAAAYSGFEGASADGVRLADWLRDARRRRGRRVRHRDRPLRTRDRPRRRARGLRGAGHRGPHRRGVAGQPARRAPRLGRRGRGPQRGLRIRDGAARRQPRPSRRSAPASVGAASERSSRDQREGSVTSDMPRRLVPSRQGDDNRVNTAGSVGVSLSWRHG